MRRVDARQTGRVAAARDVHADEGDAAAHAHVQHAVLSLAVQHRLARVRRAERDVEVAPGGWREKMIVLAHAESEEPLCVIGVIGAGGAVKLARVA